MVLFAPLLQDLHGCGNRWTRAHSGDEAEPFSLEQVLFGLSAWKGRLEQLDDRARDDDCPNLWEHFVKANLPGHEVHPAASAPPIVAGKELPANVNLAVAVLAEHETHAAFLAQFYHAGCGIVSRCCVCRGGHLHPRGETRRS